MLAERLPNAKFAVIEGSGHEVNIDDPKELAAAINDFFVKK